MHNYFAFLGKELMENLRTKKLLVLVCVFFSSAITSPLLTRYMGEFFALLLPADDEIGQLMAAALGAMTWADSYAQLYGNLGQMGALTILLLFMGIILREKSSGTADLVFTKGLQPSVFVLAKFTVSGLITLAVTFASVLIGYVYTLLLFEYAGSLVHVLMGGLVFGVFLLMMLAVITFCSAIAKSTPISAVLGLAAFMFFGFTAIIPRIGRFSPGTLMAAFPLEITAGRMPDGLGVNIAITVAIAIVSLWGATAVSAKRHSD